MTKKTEANPVHPAPETGNAARGGRPRPSRQSRLRQSASSSRLDRALSDRGGFPRAPRALPLRAARHAHFGGARRRAARARRARLRRRGAAALRARGNFDRAACGAQGRRSSAGHRQRLPADAQILRRRAQALRRHHDLLRPADRRRHRRADPAEHARGIRGGAGLALVRDPGCAGDRGRRPRQRRGGADGQYLGDAALFPCLREGRRPLDPGRPPNISAAIPT